MSLTSLSFEADELQEADEDSDEEHDGEKCISLLSSLLPEGVSLQAAGSFVGVASPSDELLGEEVVEEDHLDEMASSSCSGVTVRTRPQVPPKPPIDTVRYSMNNIKESENWQLDQLLEELSELEMQLNSDSGNQLLLGIPSMPASTSNNGFKESEVKPKVPPQTAPKPVQPVVAPTVAHPPPVTTTNIVTSPSCSSPDGDSAFGDVSSTDSSCRNRNSAFSSNDSCHGSLHTPSPTQISPRAAEQTADEIKAMKIKQALEKMKEAKVTRIFVKFFVEDGAPLQMLVDERWTVAETMRQLADKHQITLMEDHCIVEEFPELYIKRIYEDHENLVENIQMWVQDSQNKLYFTRRPDKYPFIDRPELYLVTEKSSNLEIPSGNQWTRESKQQYVEDFFSRDAIAPPEMEGFLHLKADGRKSWKKHLFVLRPSGLYYAPKGKKATSSKDLQCLMNLHSNQVYVGINWGKKYKAPTDYCISIKLTQLQIKNSQYIKYICAEDEPTFRKWIVALRIAKNGAALYDNYKKACAARLAALGATPSLRPTSPAVSCCSSQPELRQLSRMSQASSSTAPAVEYDEQPTGTIKRAPVDVIRRLSHSSSGNRSPSVEAGDEDSDEDFPAPPPPSTSRQSTHEPRPLPAAPPPKPAYYPSQVPQTPTAPVTPKKVPPPPPKRSAETKVTTAVSPVPPVMNDLEAALARRREKMAQQV